MLIMITFRWEQWEEEIFLCAYLIEYKDEERASSLIRCSLGNNYRLNGTWNIRYFYRSFLRNQISFVKVCLSL